MKGTASPAIKPGARVYSTALVDSSNNLWLFGGAGYAVSTNGYLNDLWKYNVSTNEWTWINGGNAGNETGVYGTQGNPAAVNTPGAREYAVSWKDVSGDLWLFGGKGYSASAAGYLDDLWKYNIAANEWVWIKGSNSVDIPGSYGTQGVASINNNPGAREYAVSWKDASGNFWLFGGDAYYQPGQRDYLNDLWMYALAGNCIPNTWTGNINNDWDNPGNWSCNTLPSAGSNVIIPPSANPPAMASDKTVFDIALTGILNLNGHTLTINGTVSGAGSISGSATSNLIINGDAGTVKFTPGYAVLHSLILNTGAHFTTNSNLIITGAGGLK